MGEICKCSCECDLPLGDKLESDDLSAALSSALVHFSEGAFTDGVQYVILVHLYT